MLQNEFRDESNNCRCLGDTLTFECTVTNRLGIIWRGSAFNCDNRNNEMLLYRTSQASECNNGMISGRIVRLKDTSYTSQLDVTLRSDLIGKIVECAGNNGTDSEIAISNTTLDIRMWACTSLLLCMVYYHNGCTLYKYSSISTT